MAKANIAKDQKLQYASMIGTLPASTAENNSGANGETYTGPGASHKWEIE